MRLLVITLAAWCAASLGGHAHAGSEKARRVQREAKAKKILARARAALEKALRAGDAAAEALARQAIARVLRALKRMRTADETVGTSPCPRGQEVARVPDLRLYGCRTAGTTDPPVPAYRGHLERALADVAASDLYRDEQAKCNFYLSRVGQALDIPYLRDVEGKGQRANDIFDFLEKRASRSRASGWGKVDDKQAQELADRGWLVLGAQRGLGTRVCGPGEVTAREDGRCDAHGHVAIVVRCDLGTMVERPGKNGPCMRDWQSRDKTRKASSRFRGWGEDKTDRPSWFVYGFPTGPVAADAPKP